MAIGLGGLAPPVTQGHVATRAAINLITLVLYIARINLARLKYNTYIIKPKGGEV